MSIFAHLVGHVRCHFITDTVTEHIYGVGRRFLKNTPKFAKDVTSRSKVNTNSNAIAIFMLRLQISANEIDIWH